MASGPLLDLLTPFAAGDVVELRSSGPLMTVLGWEVSLWPGESGARCAWFVQGAHRTQVFPIAALRPASKASAGKAAVTRGVSRAASAKPLATPTAPDLEGVGGDE